MVGSLSAVAADILTPKQDPVTGLYGYVNQKDKWKIKPVYKGAADFFASGASSKQQYAWVKESDGMYTLITAKGKIALDGKYFDVQKPEFLGDNTAISEVQKSENGPRQVVVICGKTVSELHEQFTTMKHVATSGSDVSYYLKNGGNSSLLTINANTGEVSSKQLDFKVVSDPYHGYYMVVKNDEHQLFNFEKGTFYPLEKFHNIWKSREKLVETKDYGKRPIFIDKDFNIICASWTYDMNDLSEDKYNGKFLILSSIFESDNQFLIDLEDGKVIGNYDDIYFQKTGLIGVCNRTKGYVEYGCLSPDGKTLLLPIEYKTIVYILDDSGFLKHIAAQKFDGSVEIFDDQGNKINSLPDEYGELYADYYINWWGYVTKFLKFRKHVPGDTYYTWFDVNCKKMTPDNCTYIYTYEKNGKQIGWEMSGKYYDMNMKLIGSIPAVKKTDNIAELYRKRNFVGRPIGAVDKMCDRGFVIHVETVWQSSFDASAIFDITLKDRSVYRIETNSMAQIIKAKKYR